MITKGYLDTSVLMETSFYEQSDTGSLWGLFVNAGYLTVEKIIRSRYFRLKVPNEELKEEFKSLTSYY